MRSARSRVGVVALGHHWQSTCPLTGVSPAIAWGTPVPSMPSTRMTSHCQPHQASVYPCCSRNPLPRCSSRVRFGRLCDTVKHAKRPDAPPVHHLEEQTSIPARRVRRLQYSAICPPLHLTSCSTGRFIEIGNVVMARVRGVNGKGHSAAQHFISPRGTKRFPTEKGLARCYIKACHRHVSCPFPSCVPDAAWVIPAQAACAQ